jgi:L-seryl-tRNA(Ser) seleniumtransferase
MAALRGLPSVDAVLRQDAARDAIARHGRRAVLAAIRVEIASARNAARNSADTPAEAAAIAAAVLRRLEEEGAPGPRPVFNLTGTVLHTNLGRAILAETAIDAAVAAMRQAVALELDLDSGRRGERDDHLRGLLCELTGAEDATIVNNNAAAVLLALNSVANGRDAIVSRGELIEIGGAFRMPDIMARAGARLVEVGTTNRTHLKDYAAAIGPNTGLLLKVHPSNYRIEGFTAEVPPASLATLAHEHGVMLAHDLGSGTLVDLRSWGLAHEPTVAEAVKSGADLVTFSGDKLLGGPQAGFIVGRRDALAHINRNPMKRALRIDKVRLAAIGATLSLYRDPDRLAQHLPTLRLLARSAGEIEALAHRLAPRVGAALGVRFGVGIIPCASQIGSGALPVETIASFGLALRPTATDHVGAAVEELARDLRRLPVPILGRIERDAVILDLRSLEDEAGFVADLAALNPAAA